MTTSNLLRRATLVGVLFTAFTGMASQPLPQDLQLVSPLDLPTNQATWFSLQRWMHCRRHRLTGALGWTTFFIEQAGETFGFQPELFMLHWNTNRSAFDIHGIPLWDFSHGGDFFEKVSFAPLNLPKK